ncbi:hypothetical protein SDC9_148647 [bioreactor metagenome]|uniref:Uncharacterized protein n=1 Tax=bioreactor metagenome TaxID=1076179 RepID=A0A645EHF0_9ZZZZ
MILMTVGQKYSEHLVGVLFKISNVRDHKINSGHIFIRETKPAVNDYYVVSELNDREILPYFSKASERDNLKPFIRLHFLKIRCDSTRFCAGF